MDGDTTSATTGAAGLSAGAGAARPPGAPPPPAPRWAGPGAPGGPRRSCRAAGVPPRPRRGDAPEILARARVHLDRVALAEEEGDLDDRAGLEGRGLRPALRGVT